MNEDSIERLHKRIDETHQVIHKIELMFTEQKQEMKNLSTNINVFMQKVDDDLFDIDKGFIIKTRTKLATLCSKVHFHFWLIGLIVVGIIGLAFRGMAKW